jgi:hypothetical protein
MYVTAPALSMLPAADEESSVRQQRSSTVLDKTTGLRLVIAALISRDPP